MEDLRISKVAPSVENRLGQVGELVKLMKSGGAGLSPSQTGTLLGYLGTLEEMRKQLGTIGEYYQDDDHVLFRITTLMDRIDESTAIAELSFHGFTKEEVGENPDGTLTKKEEEKIILQSSLQNSLFVSRTNVLDISGLIDRARARIVEEVEDDADNEWNDPITADEIAQLEQSPSLPHPTNLRQSFMDVPMPDLAVASSSSSTQTKKKKSGKCNPTLCKICYDEYTEWCLLFTLCNCEHVYCKECLEGYLTTQITNGGVLNLDCPNPECEAEINITDIYKICDEKTLEKYERFIVLASLRADPDVRWCPMQNCSSPIKGPPKDNSPWIECETCHLQVCFACGDERHDPAQCGKEAKDLISSRNNSVRVAEETFEAWHKGKPTDVKPCPKCKGYIEKNLGCNHMTCQACKHQFCWLCLQVYESVHFNSDKYPDCKGKQYWTPPSLPDPELQARYNWIYFPPNYQYAGVEEGPIPRIVPGPTQKQRIRSTAKKVGVFVGVGVAVATLGIPAAVIGGPIYGVFRLHKVLKAKRHRNQLRGESII